MTHIAFLGTGLLGSALAEAAAKRGDQIIAWNRTADKARALEQFGVAVAATPADAVRGAQRVHMVLKDDAVVEDVIAALRPGLDPATIIVDHTTNQPALTADRAKRLNAEGVRYIHCPVFIGPAAARQAQGTILASGPKALFDEIHEALSRMAERVEYFGERPDLAAVYKLCGNGFIIGIAAVVADVLAVAASSGVPGEDALKVVEYFNPAGVITGRGRSMIAKKFEPSFELAMARKDVRLMIETAAKRPLSTLPGMAARMDALIAEGYGTSDLAVIGSTSVD
jgi:3-hydroxyisobutyrate dehydrogenase